MNKFVAYALSLIEDEIPSTYKKVEISFESEMWKDIMLEEMNSLHKNDIWKLSELPKGKKVIGWKWMYAKKKGSQDGTTICYKARLIEKGYAWREGIDYNEVFPPVIKHSSIWILLALA